MVKIGGSKAAIATVMVSEILSVLLLGALLATLLTWFIATVGSDAIRSIFL
jgi:hypothetical protein